LLILYFERTDHSSKAECLASLTFPRRAIKTDLRQGSIESMKSALGDKTNIVNGYMFTSYLLHIEFAKAIVQRYL